MHFKLISNSKNGNNWSSRFCTYNKNYSVSIVIWMLILLTTSCKKSWLEEKPDISLQIPTSLADYRSLLAGTTRGGSFNVDYGTLIEHGSLDFYVKSSVYNSGSSLEKNFYSWAPDLWTEPNYGSWNIPYSKIVYTNVVLEGLEKIFPQTTGEQRDWNEIKGTALFFRAIWHYDIAKQFCKTYNKTTASSDLGIPLRLTSNFEEKSVRSSLDVSYTQILSDLKNAGELLPVLTPINDNYKCQPTKAAVYAMLARIYLSMNDFDQAKLYADNALQLYNTLTDYSTKNPSSFVPFSRFNEEVIFHMQGSSYKFLQNGSGNTFVDSLLYNSYDNDDLRKTLFFFPFSGGYIYKTSYSGVASSAFLGLATDELYLIRAECFARANNTDAALLDLNTLLNKRWKNTVPYPTITAANASEALDIVLRERRKELCLRGIRWTDLKRLNTDPQFQVTLVRTIDGDVKTLQPNSPLYVFSIPPNIIEFTGMPQNPR